VAKNTKSVTEGKEMESWETYYEYYENQEWDKLVEYCLEELKNDSEDDSLLWQLGDAYLQSGNYQKALEIGKYHYQIHPESPNAVQNYRHNVLLVLLVFEITIPLKVVNFMLLT